MKMARTAPIFFTLLYLIAMARPVAPLFIFVANQDYIAEFLCINTDKPELDCKGKCYLMQMLEEKQEKNKKELPKINLSDYPIGFIRIADLPITKIDQHLKTPIFSNADRYSYQYSFSDFHPPTRFI